MLSAGDLKPGRTIDLEGRVLQVVSAETFQPVGRGRGLVRTKLKDVESGGVFEKVFRSDQKIEAAHVQRRDHQYLYSDGQNYHFMDTESYEQIQLSAQDLGEQRGWLKEGEAVAIISYEGKMLGIDPPKAVERRVVKTDPGVKGDTATGGDKPAIIEGGAKVTVPLFVDEGDVIRVDTSTGAYVERVSRK